MKKLLLLLLALPLFASCNLATKGEKIGTYTAPRKALLVMDVQTDFVGGEARMPVAKDQVEGMIERINVASADFAAAGDRVIYIRNVFPKGDIANLFRNNAAVENSGGIKIDPRVRLVSDVVFDKNQSDAFSNKNFEKFLLDNQIDELTLSGVFADQCVYWTSVAALQRGYKVRYMINGVAAKDRKTIEKAAASIAEKGATVFSY
jgi:nicotinamidase-related amidase